MLSVLHDSTLNVVMMWEKRNEERERYLFGARP
jgi:hypothetical protein